MKIVQFHCRAGNLSLDKWGIEVDKERAVLPAIVYAGNKYHKDIINVFGIGWWKWGIRVIIHWRFKND